jgi:hypothetical protein
MLCQSRLPMLCKSTDYHVIFNPVLCDSTDHLCYTNLQTTCAMPVHGPPVLYNLTLCYVIPQTTGTMQFHRPPVLCQSADHLCYASLQTTHVMPICRPPMLCDSTDNPSLILIQCIIIALQDHVIYSLILGLSMGGYNSQLRWGEMGLQTP